MTAHHIPEESVTVKWSRLYATLYYFMGRAMLERFGQAGEKALRQAIHDYGAYRAGRVRADHEARKLAINLANMMNHGDMPHTDSLDSKNRICTASYFRTTVTGCVVYDTWRHLGGVDVGRIYCQEVHEPLYCHYADGVTLDMPDFMTKGDRICTFVLTLPDAPEQAPPPASDAYQESAAHPETKIARLYGVLYYFLARAMLNAFGDEGQDALRHALRGYAAYEGEGLNEDQLARGWEVGQGNDPVLKPVGGGATVAGQAVYDAWREMEGDGIPMGLIYWVNVASRGKL